MINTIKDISNFINVKEILKKADIQAKTSIGPAVAHIFLEDQKDLSKAIKVFQRTKPRCSFHSTNL